MLLLAVSACSSSNLTKDEYDGGNVAPGNDESPEDSSLGMPRQIIYKAALTISVADLDTAINSLNAKATSLGGYVSDSYRNSHEERPNAHINFRIPQTKYEEFLGFARELGEPSRESVNSTDVTEEYLDLEARLLNRKVHEERLLTLLSQTGSVEELLAVERELARIREDIEVIEGRLRYLKDKVSLAQVEIYLKQSPGATEVPGLKPVGFKETLRRSLRALVSSSTLFLDVISFIFIALAAILPFALPFALLVWLVFWLRRRHKSRSAGA